MSHGPGTTAVSPVSPHSSASAVVQRFRSGRSENSSKGSDMTPSASRQRTAASCADRTAGAETPTVDASIGREARVQRSPREGPESGRKPAFQREPEIEFTAHRDVGGWQLDCLLGYARTTRPLYASATAHPKSWELRRNIVSEEPFSRPNQGTFVDAPIAELRSGGLSAARLRQPFQAPRRS